jgi:Zn-finger nucleic acid-binding protein
MMPSARVVLCPSCGAAVAEGARRCAHCDAPVATLRCANCFHMNAPDAAHCSGCGRDLGLEPIPQGVALVCPDCREPMTELDCGPGKLHDCGRCGAQFLEHAALRDLVEHHDRLDVGVPRPRPAAGPVVTRVRYVACPVCRSMMNRRNFGGGSGVIVDVCTKHGTWFDAGELPHVLAFVESGGLTRARAKAHEQERERASRERIAETTGPATMRSLRDAAGEPSFGSMVVDLLTELFGGFR